MARRLLIAVSLCALVCACDTQRGQPPAQAEPRPVAGSSAIAKPADPGHPQPVPTCIARDSRVEIPVWNPSVDADGNLSSPPPPRKDGRIVFIDLHRDDPGAQCNDEALATFNLPDDPKDAMAGGLAVNIRGNTQFANGSCHFHGYYMNQDVAGMHQGWTETFFGAVEMQKIVLSDKFCVSRQPD